MMKPAQWPWRAAQTSPEWRCLARRLRFGVHFWERLDRVGPCDVVGGLKPTWSSIGGLTPGTYVYPITTQHGRAWKWDEAADYQTKATWTQPGPNWWNAPRCYEVLMRIPSSGLASRDHSLWGGFGFACFLWWTGTNHTLRFWRYTSGSYGELSFTAGNYPTGSFVHLVVNYPTLDAAFTVYFNGVLAGTSSTGSGTENPGGASSISSSSSDTSAGHQFSLFRVYGVGLKPDMIARLARDPFGMLWPRMRGVIRNLKSDGVLGLSYRR